MVELTSIQVAMAVLIAPLTGIHIIWCFLLVKAVYGLWFNLMFYRILVNRKKG